MCIFLEPYVSSFRSSLRRPLPYHVVVWPDTFAYGGYEWPRIRRTPRPRRPTVRRQRKELCKEFTMHIVWYDPRDEGGLCFWCLAYPSCVSSAYLGLPFLVE